MTVNNIQSYTTGNDYIKERTRITKDIVKKHIIELNSKKSAKDYILSQLTGTEQKVYCRVRNTNPNRRQNFLSRVRTCSKIVLDINNELLTLYVQRGPFYREAIYRYKIQEYGIRWAFKKEDFVEVW